MGPRNKLEILKKIPVGHFRPKSKYSAEPFFINNLNRISKGRKYWVARAKFSKISDTPMAYRKKEKNTVADNFE